MQTVPPKLVIVGAEGTPIPTDHPHLIVVTDPAHIAGLDRSIRPIDEALGCIYQIICLVTGISYIGQAKLIKYKDGKAYYYGPKGRWNDHKSDAKNGSPKLIHQAIRDYGPENFQVLVVKVDIITALNHLETHYIIAFNTLIPNGYNVQSEADNRYTPARIQRIQEKYGEIIQPQDPAVMEELRITIQAELDDKHHRKWELIKGKITTRIRIARSNRYSAPRHDGQIYGYTAIIIYVYHTEMKTPQDTIKLAFGGVTISTEVAYRDALQFARRIPLEQGGQFDDQVKLG